MKIFDCHIHIFADKVIENVQKKSGLVDQLKLQALGAEKRTSVEQLKAEMTAAEVAGALMLPTANVAGVRKTNRDCVHTAEAHPFIKTAGTLHPDAHDVDAELRFLRQHQVRMIKLCTFSQGFELSGSNAGKMFEVIQSINHHTDSPFAVMLDTLFTADRHFGTRPEFNTTPQGLASLADRYPGINFIGAHMGGLDAPYDEISGHLSARPNLYLDTSNAAHTLSKRDFCDLAARHGPGHILFGTDWPWFSPAKEVALIDNLLDHTGFSEAEKSMVFGTNICGLLGL
jgi:predicted TIM-barrel fold metal-dependent hydrolase